MPWKSKEDKAAYMRKWYEKNRAKCIASATARNATLTPAKRLQYDRAYRKRKKALKPWVFFWYYAYNRCTYPGVEGYSMYGGAGIRCLFTKEEVRLLWVRDSAHLLTRPSVDRKDSSGHYTFENCRFIELSENSRLGARNKYDNNEITTWED